MAQKAQGDMETAFTQAAGGRRVKVRRGRAVVGVVPLEDLELLEQLEADEDQRLGAAAAEAKAEWEASGEPTVPWAEVKRNRR